MHLLHMVANFSTPKNLEKQNSNFFKKTIMKKKIFIIQ